MATKTLLVISHGANLDGGAEHVFAELIRSLATRQPGLSVAAVLPEPGELSQACELAGVNTTLMPIPRWADFPGWGWRNRLIFPANLGKAVIAAVFLMARSRPEAVVSNTMTIPSYALAAKLLRIPHFWLVHEFGDRDHGLQFALGKRVTFKLIARLSKRVVCCSEAVEHAVREAAPKAETCVLYYAVAGALCPPRPRPRTRQRIELILIGRYAASKGQDLALAAVGLLVAEGIDVGLTCVGSGSTAPFVRMARDLGIESRVNFCGATSDVTTHLVAADVALMCSRDEAFGRVTVEAMQAGLPVCGTRSGGTTEIICEHVNGLLSPPGDAGALSGNLRQLALDEPFRMHLATGAFTTGQRFKERDYGGGLLAIIEAFCH